MDAKVVPEDVRISEPVQVYGRVHVVGVKIPFGEMVMLLIKLALAAIPAAIILTIIGAFSVAFLGGLFAGHHPVPQSVGTQPNGEDTGVLQERSSQAKGGASAQDQYDRCVSLLGASECTELKARLDALR